jgi:hypothetical protein
VFVLSVMSLINLKKKKYYYILYYSVPLICKKGTNKDISSKTKVVFGFRLKY